MRPGDPLLGNKWFHTGKHIINLDWVARIAFDPDNARATIFMAAGKRKKIKIRDEHVTRLREMFQGLLNPA